MSTRVLSLAHPLMTMLGCCQSGNCLTTYTPLVSRLLNTPAGRQLDNSRPTLAIRQPAKIHIFPMQFLPTGQPTCFAALHSHVPSRGQEWPSVILCGYYYTLNPAQFRAIWEQGILWQGERTVFALAVTGCKCKAKTALVSTVTPTSPASFGCNLGWARSRHACR